MGLTPTVTVLDANVLIGYLDSNDAHHDWAVSTLVAHRHSQLTVSALTHAEYLVSPSSSSQLVDALTKLMDLELDVESIDELSAVRLARLVAKTRLKLPDAVTLLTALEREGSLLTCDKQLARVARELGVVVHEP